MKRRLSAFDERRLSRLQEEARMERRPLSLILRTSAACGYPAATVTSSIPLLWQQRVRLRVGEQELGTSPRFGPRPARPETAALWLTLPRLVSES